MYGLLSLFMGVLVAVMIVFNGDLTGVYGAYGATVLIHVAGLCLISLIVLLRREKPFSKRAPLLYYAGGALGVLTTVFNNASYGQISVAAILALGLFGQSVTGIVFDEFGLIGMPVRKFYKEKLIGLALVMAGIGCMLEKFVLVPVILTFLSGVVQVVSRTTNARLSECTSQYVSTFFNYVIGLAVALPVLLVLGRGEPILMGRAAVDPRIYIYLGGMIGVVVVYLSNVTVAKISAFYLTLFMFVGQVFTGVGLDALITGAFDIKSLIGGVFVALGLALNLFFDHRREHRAVKTE